MRFDEFTNCETKSKDKSPVVKRQTLRQRSKNAWQRLFSSLAQIRRVLVSLCLIHALLIQLFTLPVSNAANNEPHPENTVKTEKNIETKNQKKPNKDSLNPNLPPKEPGDQTVIIFDQTFERTSLLTKQIRTFTLPAGAVAPFLLQVVNGNPDGTGRVLDGMIKINGVPVINSGDLSLETPPLAMKINLALNNTIEVEFFSPRPKAFLNVTITATFRTPNSPPPVITSFTPDTGIAGMSVTLNGSRLKPTVQSDTSQIIVTFAGQNNTRRPASISFASPAQVRVTIPNGAITGPIELTNDYGRATTATSFIVEPTTDFAVFVSPTIINAVQASSGAGVISVNSVRNDFTQLAALSTTGLPAGVTAAFNPPQITAGGTSTLTINLSQVNLSPGSYPFTVRGTATIDGTQVTRTAQATLNVVAAGQTTLTGRVLSTEKEPVMGATVSVQPEGRSAVTNAAGVFFLTDIMAGTDRAIQIDGRTANAPGRNYPVITEPATVVAGQTNVVPFTFYLPQIDTQYEVTVVPGQTTVAGNPKVENLQMTVPPDANLRNRDGTPVTRVSITALAIDRTPAPLPSNVRTSLVYTSQPGGAIPTGNVRIPVVYPNLGGDSPGTQLPLYAFNHDTVQWYVYGSGRVSADGRTVVPEIDPSTGRSYGLRDFSWHFVPVGNNGDPGGDGPTAGSPSGSSSKTPSPSSCSDSKNTTNMTPNPVDLSTGMKIEVTTDISFGGVRGGLELTRTYTSNLAQLFDNLPFGRGITHNYAMRLTGDFQVGGFGRPLRPVDVTGKIFSYLRTDPDGALVFTPMTMVAQLGDVIRKLPNGTFEYRYKDGEVRRFDTNRRMTSITDRNGNMTALTYTGNNLTQIKDAGGRSITLHYDGSNRIIQATDPLGNIWNYGYENNLLTNVTDPLGNVTRYGYGVFGSLATVTDPRGVVVKQIIYDGVGRVSEQMFADGGVERYSYELSGQTVTTAIITDPLGRVTTKRFNAAGYVIEETDALSQISRIERDLTNNLPLSIFGPCGCAEVTRTFDSRGNPLTVTNRMGQTTRYTFEPVFNNLTQVTDRLNRVTNYGYDLNGNLISMTNALNETTTYVYDGFGQLTSITDALGHTSQLEYDNEGNIRALIDALGNRMMLEYDGMSRLTSFIDPLNRRIVIEYDEIGRIVSVKDPAQAITKFDYDGSGNLVTSTDALGRMWTNVYDLKNNLLMRIDPLGRTTRYEYNADDELTSMTSPSGRTMRYAYDARGQVSNMTDPLNGIVSFTYDNRGNLSTLTDERGNTTTFTYDELYRPKERRDPVGKTSGVNYDPVGNIIESIDLLNRHTNITYDALNRPTQVVYTDATVAYFYDAAGRRTHVDDTQGGSIVWNYDNANRLLSETTPAGTISYGYNTASQRASMTAADRPPVTYGYDTAGRLQTITQGAEVFTYSYDTLSRLMSLQRPNGVTTNYGYDTVNRLARLTHTNAQNQAIEDFQYTYNTDDEIASINSLASAQLMSSAQTVGTADAANRIRQFGQANFNFDDEGQTINKTDNQGITNYQWDARGRLTRATLPNGQTANYGYDSLGRRSSRTAGGVTTSFLYDDYDIVLDRGSDNSTDDYLNGLGIDNKLRQASSTTGGFYFLQDHLGSTSALTNSTGNVIERMQYEGYGEDNDSAFTRYSYTGRERDNLTGMLYYRARWYDPQQGRFFSEDAIDFVDGLNLYGYVSNNPTNLIDPSGQLKLKSYTRKWSVRFKKMWSNRFEKIVKDAGYGSCCGWSRDCSKVEACFENPQQQACADHDVCMHVKANDRSPLETDNEAVAACHETLCKDSTDPPIRLIFCDILKKRSQRPRPEPLLPPFPRGWF
jgi:RHS repeat-associated protein